MADSPKIFRAQALVKGERFLDLDRRQAYFETTQHDYKRFDWDGRLCRPGPATQQPLLSAEAVGYYVPLRTRRPSAPVRLGKCMVDAFTTLLYGEERWPRFLCQGDDDTQDYAEALQKEQDLRLKMIELRNCGGSMGSAGLSWAFLDGKPRVEVHYAKNLFVQEWKDRKALVPAFVTEVYLYPQEDYDAEKGRMVRSLYWYRHDWTEDEEIAYEPVKWKAAEEPSWIPSDDSVEHKFGFCPFIWVQNTPSTEIDGQPDYHGQYEAMDSLDIISSVLGRGTTLNLDPTLVLSGASMSPDVLKRVGVKKGSDNSIAVGDGGDAKYLELAGTGVEAGIKVFELERRSILEACQCVLPDPNEVAASGTSSVAIKAIYQPMLGKAAVYREQYGRAMKRLLEQQLSVARARHGQSITITVPADPDNGQPEETTEEAVQYIDLPPRTVDVPSTDEHGIETGEKETTEEDRDPGKGERIELAWGEWFPMTPTDRNQAVQALQLAAGAKPVLSQQTAVEEAATIFNRNPDEEWGRLQTAQKADEAKQAEQAQQMFPGAGGGGLAIGADGKLKPAGKPNPSPKPPGGPPKGPAGDDEQGAALVNGNPFAKKNPFKK